MEEKRSRHELAEFLKRRRKMLSPLDFRLEVTGRRRAIGLTREEVSRLAGMSEAWYTYLEQGREIRMSKGMLMAVADVLRLNESERLYLFNLAGGGDSPWQAFGDADVHHPALQRYLERLGTMPSLIHDRCFTVHAMNEPMARMIKPLLSPEDQDSPNLLKLIFSNSAYQSRCLNWEENARSMVGRFRLLNSARLDEHDVVQLIDRLEQRSPHFLKWWRNQEVGTDFNGDAVVSYQLAEGTTLSFYRVAMSLLGTDDRILFSYVPFNEQTDSNLHLLIKQKWE